MTTRTGYRSWNTAHSTAPPSSCVDLVESVWGHGCNGRFPARLTDCYPWMTASESRFAGVFYSPATACPEGWLTHSTRTTSSRTTEEWVPGETAITCCPQQYIGQLDRCILETGDSYTNTLCQNGRTSEEVVTFTRSGLIRPSADYLRLRYQQSDLTATAMSEPATRTSGADTRSGSHDGLSTGAKAAIGTVIPAVLIIAVLAGFCLWKRKKQRNVEAEPEGNGMIEETGAQSKAELDANETATTQTSFTSAVDGGRVLPKHELHGESAVVTVPTELEDRTGRIDLRPATVHRERDP